MKPKDELLLSLLSNNDVTFYIPPYQRNYEWTDAQCDVFFNDIVKVAESNLNGKFSEHFFGTIVYVQNDHVFGDPYVLVLTDGQQRITTTMLFLAAVRDNVNNDKIKEHINKKYLKNENISSDTEFKIKLKQVEKDWDSYKNIVLSKSVSEKDKETAVWRNYDYFKTRIEKYIASSENDIFSLVDKGIANFRVVTIELEPKRNFWENPQEVFESMNSLGKPLSLADLVRNYILLGKDADMQETLYHDYWLSIENNLPNKLSDYIRDYMQLTDCASYKKATEKNYKELYGQFKDLFSDKDSIELLKELKKYSNIYAQVVLGGSTGETKIDQKLSDLRTIDVTTLYSFLVKIIDEWNEKNLTTNIENGRIHEDCPESLGRMKMFYGNFGVMVRALTYVMILGKEGLRRTSQVAVLNARYLEHELSRNYDMAIDQPCMHEFVMTLKRQHHDLGVSAMDIAKGMIDRGIHPPTMYFPLIVEEALMVEPTETEPKAVLDEAVRVLNELLDLAASDPQALQACPTTTPVGRIDEVQAARHPILRWQKENE